MNDWREQAHATAVRSAVAHDCQLVYLVCSGSHAYGTSTPESDHDIRGVFMPPRKHFVGLQRSECKSLTTREPDLVLHPIDKFFHLAVKNNPNILDWLFVPEDMVLFETCSWAAMVRNQATMFLSQRLAARFGGYARGHFHKMEMGQESTRDLGAQRKADLARFGFSTKNAMHLIRLARMACEVLETGRYNVRRPDWQELIDIRAGKWSKDRVVAEGNQLLARLETLTDKSPLPAQPALDKIEGILVDLVMESWKT